MRSYLLALLLVLPAACVRDQPAEIVVGPSEPGRGTPSYLGFTVPPGDRVSCAFGDSLNRVEATVYDSARNIVTAFDGMVRITLGRHPDTAALWASWQPLPTGATARASQGRATFSDLQLVYFSRRTSGGSDIQDYGAAPSGTYTLTASLDSGAPPLESPPFRIKPLSSLRLTFTGQPQDGIAGEAQNGVQVAIYDSAMNQQRDCNPAMTIDVGQHPVGAALVGPWYGGTTLTFGPIWAGTPGTSNGVAAFPYLRLDQPGAYTLIARAIGWSPPITESMRFSVQDPVRVRGKLIFDYQPGPAPAGTRIISAMVNHGGAIGLRADLVRVWALDSGGSNGFVYGAPVTISLGANPGDATLSGSLIGPADNGFSALRIDRPGNGYTLIASAPGLESATSAPFEVLPPPPTDAVRLGFATLPTTEYPDPPPRAGTVLPPTEVVVLDDIWGASLYNFGVATTYAGPITLSLNPNASGGTLSGTLTVNAVHGMAVFSDLVIDRGGVYGITATAPGVAGTRTGVYVAP